MADEYQKINESLIRIYNGILWIEEKKLRESTFNDLTIKEMHAIDAISMYDHQTSSQVAKKLHLSPGTMTATANRLIAKGYAKRFHDEEDRRIIRLGLTHKGRVLYRAHRAYHNMMVKSFLKDMSESEQKIIHKALRNLEDFVDDHS
ncbi:MarR family winged helix-turn-helix transcriptional regulator [Limosilactobacillus fastidiosus]|uniref:MarR family transcriptional regulator n=1 Tax=Limosilactobacillus fastidiosus TaxID=2759855 RepID=A0A7W3TYA9_9LACO|nr:MarR family transcriptional regulator [Limosilactobacillus fastidiosus]MBB1062511.1 MarR family transcriptional regulator [Limosilactobacillus fastidiosus]MBB1085538.1 MarR family transcriptional regulator [Limosilactobacillus fastidiosus]MCD7083585.1 MarR family transcriptional regulator [Limosilactobacillus fastidiosus]MCD7085991.1 MarR family transcriptional regulator [Limosilactobacillus fastidiosus]MCD7114365.1 MarR family transcriptional regulator [Limosilactobacillus fastidiosus]